MEVTLELRYNSELYLENGWFQGNGRVDHDLGTGISVEFNSTATIKNVTCIENVVGCLENYRNSTVFVEDSLFANNTFMTVHLDDGKFTSKNNTFVMDPYGNQPTSLKLQGEIHLIIADCYMFSHRATRHFLWLSCGTVRLFLFQILIFHMVLEFSLISLTTARSLQLRTVHLLEIPRGIQRC